MAFVFTSQSDAEMDESLRAFYATLSEKDGFRFVALEARRLGHGGVTYAARVFGCSERTIEREVEELDELPRDPAAGRVRRARGGPKKGEHRSATRRKLALGAGGSSGGRSHHLFKPDLQHPQRQPPPAKQPRRLGTHRHGIRQNPFHENTFHPFSPTATLTACSSGNRIPISSRRHYQPATAETQFRLTASSSRESVSADGMKIASDMARRLLTAVVLICTVGVLLCSTFGSSSVCVECGCWLSATDFQLPLFQVTYWRRQNIEDTPFSTAARDLGFVKPHSHNWKMIHGSGNGISCALGDGGELVPTVRSRGVAQFLLDSSRLRGRDEAFLWFQTALDYRKSRAVNDWIRMNSFPADGFTAAIGYDDWRKRADVEWSEFVEQNAARWPSSDEQNDARERPSSSVLNGESSTAAP